MHKYFSIVVLLCLGVNIAHAEYFDKAFKPGYELLEQGDYDQALETFEQLKTDNPESELVDYSIASVFYKKALALKEDSAGSDQIDQSTGAAGINTQQSTLIGEFSAAKKKFEAINTSNSEFLREHAPLNAANCASQIAKTYHPEHQYKERVSALSKALSEYDAYLGQFPEQDVAQRNRDHVSYLLKQLLRNPPEEEEQQEGDESEENDEQQDQEQEDSDNNEDESNENEDEQEGESSQDAEQEENEGEDESEQSSGSDENQSESSEPQEGENGKSPEEQNMEAILESLEAKNQEEQKNLRRSKNAPRVKGGKWW